MSGFARRRAGRPTSKTPSWSCPKGSTTTTLTRELSPQCLGDTHPLIFNSFFPLFSSYIYNLLTDEASVRQTTTSVLADFLADGVCYLELRTTPRATPQLTLDAYVATLLSTISAFEAEHPRLHTRLILSVDRRHTPEQAASVLRLALEHRERGVVGLDLCGDPKARPGGEVAVFTPVFEEARRQGLQVTVHFAEAPENGAREETEVLLGWRPGRLGHVIWEDDEAKREIARRGIGLELCLSCNVQGDMIRGGFEDHHFKEWRDVQGPRISLGVSLC